MPLHRRNAAFLRRRCRCSAVGRAEGYAELFLSQLAIKFGPLPPAVTERVRQADMTEVTTWALRMLTATTLAETLESPPTRKPARRPTKPRG